MYLESVSVGMTIPVLIAKSVSPIPVSHNFILPSPHVIQYHNSEPT